LSEGSQMKIFYIMLLSLVFVGCGTDDVVKDAIDDAQENITDAAVCGKYSLYSILWTIRKWFFMSRRLIFCYNWKKPSQ